MRVPQLKQVYPEYIFGKEIADRCPENRKSYFAKSIELLIYYIINRQFFPESYIVKYAKETSYICDDYSSRLSSHIECFRGIEFTDLEKAKIFDSAMKKIEELLKLSYDDIKVALQ